VKICVYTFLLFEVAAFVCDIGPSVFDGLGRQIYLINYVTFSRA
jgi:hypothetical protein